MTDTPKTTVIYCEGWNGDAKAVAGAISADEARRRYEAGEQFAALLLVDDDPTVLLEISWAHHAIAIYGFDSERRRRIKRDLRQISPETLFMVEELAWKYASAEDAELTGSAARICQSFGTDGDVVVITEQRRTGASLPPEVLRVPCPAFGDWAPIVLLGYALGRDGSPIDLRFNALLAAAGGGWYPEPLLPPPIGPATVFSVSQPPAGLPSVPAAAPTWLPPQPYLPDPAVLVFDDGHETTDRAGRRVRAVSHELGRLRVPTGSVAVRDLWDLSAEGPIVVEVQPGTYPVNLNVITGEDYDAPLAVSARLLISSDEVVSWEMAHRPGENPRLLLDGGAFGFPVDTGEVCVVDESLAHEEFDTNERMLIGDDVPVSSVGDNPAGLAVIAFPAGFGDGRFPVFLGRDKDGRTVSMVVDLGVLPPAHTRPEGIVPTGA